MKKIEKTKRFVKKIIAKVYTKYNSPLRQNGKIPFVFIHINKTGGTSIAEAIGLPLKNHLTVKEVIGLIGEDKFRSAFVFAVVRNPWEKVVSHYKYRVKTNQNNLKFESIDFKTWVRKTYGENKDPMYYDNPKMFAPQCEWLKDSTGKICIDYILKFENLNEDFEKVKNILKIKRSLPHLNATKKDSFKDYYDKETAEIVGKWFSEDINKFNYTF